MNPLFLGTVRVALAAIIFTLAGNASAEEGWLTDYEAAKKQAAKEGKDILIDFTGSDWCGWCIRLKKEVFSQESFKKEAPKHFVLLELDYPRKKQLEAKLKAQNEKLKNEFAIQGYPTIMLTDATGKAYAKTGYQAGGPEKYIAHLSEKRAAKVERDKSFAAAAKAKNKIEKAKLLDQALSKIETTGGVPVMSVYSDIVDQIITLDAKNKAGLKAKYESILVATEIKDSLQAIMRGNRGAKPEELIAKVDQLIKEKAPKGEALQEVLFMKSNLYFRVKDMKKAETLLREAMKIAPDSKTGKRIPGVLERFFGDKKAS